MATGASQNQIEAFYDFLGKRLESGPSDLSPEDSVREFRLYQEELDRFIRETEPAIEQSKAGRTQPLDVDAIMERVEARLATKGTTD